MPKFVYNIIFQEARKDLIIDGEGTQFEIAKSKLLSIFAENIDFSNKVITFSPYKQNTPQLWESIKEFSNEYKDCIPQVQQLLPFFKHQEEKEWFYVGLNNSLQQEDLIKIGASLDYLNSGKPYHESIAEIDKLFEQVIDKYEIYTFLGSGRKHFYGEKDKTKRRCRFCNHTEEMGAKFSTEAHAISDLLGNKVLFSYDECDECNEYLGSHCEQDFGEFLKFERCLYGIKSRSGIPIIKGENFEMSHPEGEDIKVKFYVKDDFPSEISDLKLIFNIEFNPQNIYRALSKFFLSLVPLKYKNFFNNTGLWIKSLDDEGNKVSLTNLPIVKKLRVNSLYERPQLIMYIRKDDDLTLPFAVGEFHIFNYIFVFLIPNTDKDNRDFSIQENYNNFWDFFKHYKSMPDWEELSLNNDEKQNQSQIINFRC